MTQRIQRNTSNTLSNIKEESKEINSCSNYLKQIDSRRRNISKKEKIMIGIKIDKDIANKVKSFSYENDITVSEILEAIIKSAFDEVKINEQALKAYEEKYKKKSKPDKNSI